MVGCRSSVVPCPPPALCLRSGGGLSHYDYPTLRRGPDLPTPTASFSSAPFINSLSSHSRPSPIRDDPLIRVRIRPGLRRKSVGMFHDGPMVLSNHDLDNSGGLATDVPPARRYASSSWASLSDVTSRNVCSLLVRFDVSVRILTGTIPIEDFR